MDYFTTLIAELKERVLSLPDEPRKVETNEGFIPHNSYYTAWDMVQSLDLARKLAVLADLMATDYELDEQECEESNVSRRIELTLVWALCQELEKDPQIVELDKRRKELANQACEDAGIPH